MSLSKRARRRWFVLSGIVLILAIGAWWVNQQLEPVRLTNTVLGKIGRDFNLKFEFSGQPSYVMKPEPRIALPNLKVINPIDNKVFASALRVEISLPWSTLLGDTPHITRIEADDVVLTLPGLRTWQATRPAKPFETPTFTNGLEITNGQLLDTGYAVKNIRLSLPHLENQQPVEAEISGVFEQGQTKISFNGSLNIAKAGLNSGFTLASKGKLNLGEKLVPYDMKTTGTYSSLENSFDIKTDTLRWISESPLPNLQTSLNISIGETLTLDGRGVIDEWPKDWPVLPAPINRKTKNIPFQLNYSGKPDFSDAISLTLKIDESRFNSSLKIAYVQQWINQNDGSPLPPMHGQFNTPVIELDGVSLEGVSIEITPDAAK